MGDEKDAFYVVRKGDIIGIYKSFADCQAQAGFSPLDPSVSVYKGYCLSKEAESYLVSRGLKQAGFSVSASDVRDELFGALSVCPIQDTFGSSSSSGNPLKKPVNLRNYVEPQSLISPARVTVPATAEVGGGLKSFSPSSQQKPVELKNYIEPRDNVFPARVSAESSLFPPNPQKRPVELKNYIEPQLLVPTVFDSTEFNYKEPQQLIRPVCQSCTIEFDGASKGNPGPAGAGAVLRATDGSEVWRVREGVGIATNNVAEYRAVILGMRSASQKGYKHVRVRGDSQLVCFQIQGKWKTKNENMAILCKEAKELTKKFTSFAIEHVLREFNFDADAQANQAINLRDGQVEMDGTGSRT